MALENTEKILEQRKELGQLIQKLRGDGSKYAVAKATGLTQNQVSAIENGERNYGVDSLLAVLDFYGYVLK